MKPERVFSCLLAIFLFILPCQVSAQVAAPEGISFGNLKVIPGFEGQAVYDDNIFLKNGSNDTTQKKVSDWIYHTKPSLLLNYTMPERGFVNLGYRGDWAFYNDNDANNWKNNQGFLAVDYKSPGGLIVGIDNLYVSAEDPYGSPDQYAIGRVTKRWSNDLKSRVGYLFTERFRSFLYYNYYRQDYKSDLDAAQDYDDNEFGVGVEAKFLPRTWGFLRYHYGQRSFFSDLVSSNLRADSNWNKVSTGLTWDASAKLTGELNFGYLWKTYDNTATNTALLRPKDVNDWVAATTLSYRPLETTTLILTVLRTLRDASADTGENFVDTLVGLNLEQVMLRRFILKLGGMYGRNDYNTDRKDDNYQANAGVDYKPREWLTLGVEYCYKQKNSNIVENEFKDNQVIASVRIVY